MLANDEIDYQLLARNVIERAVKDRDWRWLFTDKLAAFWAEVAGVEIDWLREETEERIPAAREWERIHK